MKYQHAIFDFDGVMVESNEIRRESVLVGRHIIKSRAVEGSLEFLEAYYN